MPVVALAASGHEPVMKVQRMQINDRALFLKFTLLFSFVYLLRLNNNPLSLQDGESIVKMAN